MRLAYFPDFCSSRYCLVAEGHTHPVCGDCGAVGYSGDCLTCRATRIFDRNPVYLDRDYPEEDE